MMVLFILAACEIGPRFEPATPKVVEFTGTLVNLADEVRPNKQSALPGKPFLEVEFTVDEARWQATGELLANPHERYQDFFDPPNYKLTKRDARAAQYDVVLGERVVVVYDEANGNLLEIRKRD